MCSVHSHRSVSNAKNEKKGLRHVLSWPKLGLELKFHDIGTFGGLEKHAQSLSDIQRIFNTGEPPLKIKILKIGLGHVLSWPKLSLKPKCHDPGTFFTFFALDRLGAPKKKIKHFFF